MIIITYKECMFKSDAANADSADTAVKTGDDMNLLALFALMTAAALAAGIALINRRERR